MIIIVVKKKSILSPEHCLTEIISLAYFPDIISECALPIQTHLVESLASGKKIGVEEFRHRVHFIKMGNTLQDKYLKTFWEEDFCCLLREYIVLATIEWEDTDYSGNFSEVDAQRLRNKHILRKRMAKQNLYRMVRTLGEGNPIDKTSPLELTETLDILETWWKKGYVKYYRESESRQEAPFDRAALESKVPIAIGGCDFGEFIFVLASTPSNAYLRPAEEFGGVFYKEIGRIAFGHMKPFYGRYHTLKLDLMTDVVASSIRHAQNNGVLIPEEFILPRVSKERAEYWKKTYGYSFPTIYELVERAEGTIKLARSVFS